MFFFLLGMHLIEMSLISIGISFNLRIKKFRFTFISKYDELIIANLNDNHFVDIKKIFKNLQFTIFIFIQKISIQRILKQEYPICSQTSLKKIEKD